GRGMSHHRPCCDERDERRRCGTCRLLASAPGLFELRGQTLLEKAASARDPLLRGLLADRQARCDLFDRLVLPVIEDEWFAVFVGNVRERVGELARGLA